jgi:3-oxoacyl-[acyl-carrier-protein] synthase II
MSRSHELSTANHIPEQACRPFDRDHDGIVLSEGSAAFIIESWDQLNARGGSAYAEIVSHTSGIDGTAMFSTEESGTSAVSLARDCLRQAQLAPTLLSYVCANGNSLPSLDRKEIHVLSELLGESASFVPVSSIKSILGHALGAASAFQVAASCMAMRQSLVPPNFNLAIPDEPSNLDLLVAFPRCAKLQDVLVCSYGFGGVNAFMVLRNTNTNPRSDIAAQSN